MTLFGVLTKVESLGQGLLAGMIMITVGSTARSLAKQAA